MGLVLGNRQINNYRHDNLGFAITGLLQNSLPLKLVGIICMDRCFGIEESPQLFFRTSINHSNLESYDW